ncbi:MAG: hypothetical protein WCY54_09045 [Syntrophales bacterium]
MERPKLLPGDEFATANPMALGKIINVIQTAKAVDNDSEYTHTGIIVDPHGATLEALWTVNSQNLWEAYKGKKVLIVRNTGMTPKVFAAGMEKIQGHIGQWYPAHRLILHVLHVAKWIHWDRIVCSELTAKFEAGCAEYLGEDKAAGFMRNYYGINPDDLVDRWKISRYYTTVFEGIAE